MVRIPPFLRLGCQFLCHQLMHCFFCHCFRLIILLTCFNLAAASPYKLRLTPTVAFTSRVDRLQKVSNDKSAIPGPGAYKWTDSPNRYKKMQETNIALATPRTAKAHAKAAGGAAAAPETRYRRQKTDIVSVTEPSTRSLKKEAQEKAAKSAALKKKWQSSTAHVLYEVSKDAKQTNSDVQTRPSIRCVPQLARVADIADLAPATQDRRVRKRIASARNLHSNLSANSAGITATVIDPNFEHGKYQHSREAYEAKAVGGNYGSLGSPLSRTGHLAESMHAALSASDMVKPVRHHVSPPSNNSHRNAVHEYARYSRVLTGASMVDWDHKRLHHPTPGSPGCRPSSAQPYVMRPPFGVDP